jgi:hypothetical protein
MTSLRYAWVGLSVLALACGDSDESGEGGGTAAGTGGQGATSAGTAGTGGTTATGTGGSGATGGGTTSGPGMRSCFDACESAHPGGRDALATHAQSCACDSCSPTCDGACSSGVLDDACTYECIHPSLHMGICGGARSACQQDDAVCGPYYQCVVQCIQPTTTGEVPIDQLRQMCIDRINDYRELESKQMLVRQLDQEICADEAAANDAINGPHDSYGSCSEASQCECIGLNQNDGGRMLMLCLEMMYMEKYTGEQNQGHYKAMVNTSHTAVACGFSGSWGTQNYY